MTQGVLHRAGVAIVLTLTLLLPYGRCQSPARATGHDCCVHQSPAASVKTNCCAIRSELPAIVEQRAVVSPNPLAVLVAILPAEEFAVSFAASATTAAPHRSSPPGKSILRI